MWRYEEIKTICFRLLESFWPSDPVRLIRIRVSECKNIAEVKKDKDIESFATKISKDQQRLKTEADLASLSAKIRTDKSQGNLSKATP